jgi:glycosyltransferase involved in cell wall biosynthesis
VINKLKFCCFGGLNSISRKNIDKIIEAFYSIYQDKSYNNWQLNIYIQGVEIPNIIEKYKCPNIIYNINNLTYKSIIDKYNENDIFIHLGSHEGLGLGFYEALYTGTPILTINWTPNNEIIFNNINGWIIDCDYSNVNDNSNSLIYMGILDQSKLKLKIIDILSNNNTLNIINNTINSTQTLFKKNKNIFEKNIIDILT